MGHAVKDSIGFGIFFSTYENTKKLLFGAVHNGKKDSVWLSTPWRQRALEAVSVSVAGGLAGISYQM